MAAVRAHQEGILEKHDGPPSAGRRVYCTAHDDRPAIGVCTSCGKAFCAECACPSDPLTTCAQCTTDSDDDSRSNSDLRLKLVAHFRDGRIMKGTTARVNMSAEGFYMKLLRGDLNGSRVFVPFKELKSVYHVRDFEGSPDTRRVNGTHVEAQLLGRKIVIEYGDGEQLECFLTGRYRPSTPRFNVVPANGSSNNISVLVERTAVAGIDFVTPGT